MASTPFLNAIRWLLLLAGLVAGVWRAPAIVQDYRGWRSEIHADPSDADLYRTEFYIELVKAAIPAGLGFALFMGLRERPGVRVNERN